MHTPTHAHTLHWCPIPSCPQAEGKPEEEKTTKLEAASTLSLWDQHGGGAQSQGAVGCV